MPPKKPSYHKVANAAKASAAAAAAAAAARRARREEREEITEPEVIEISDDESECGYEGGVEHHVEDEGEALGMNEEAYEVLDEVLEEIDAAGLLEHDERCNRNAVLHAPSLRDSPEAAPNNVDVVTSLAGSLPMRAERPKVLEGVFAKMMVDRSANEWKKAEGGIKGNTGHSERTISRNAKEKRDLHAFKLGVSSS